MSENLLILLRALTYGLAATIGITLTILAIVAIMVALGGTGGFTADPPPDQPGYLAAILVMMIWAAIEAALYFGWKKLIRAFDEL